MPRRNIVVGLAGTGVAAGVAAAIVAHRVLTGRVRSQADPTVAEDLSRGPALESGWVEMSDGGRLRVVQRGQGRPIVLVHGVALSHRCWRYQLDDLAGDATVIAYDLRGHGESTLGTDGLTLSRLAADLCELLEARDVRDAVLVGHSLGGMVVMRMLAEHPDLVSSPPTEVLSGGTRSTLSSGRVAALGLVATSASPARGSGVPGARTVMKVVQPVTAHGAWLASRLPGSTLPAGDVSFLLARFAFGARPDAAHIDLTRDMTSHIPLRVSAELILEMLQLDQEATLGDLALPTAIVVGDRDLMTPLRHARALVRAIPSAWLVELPGCGHMVMLERRHALNQVVRDLLHGDTANLLS